MAVLWGRLNKKGFATAKPKGTKSSILKLLYYQVVEYGNCKMA
jgi:hypothetical protein